MSSVRPRNLLIQRMRPGLPIPEIRAKSPDLQTQTRTRGRAGLPEHLCSTVRPAKVGVVRLSAPVARLGYGTFPGASRKTEPVCYR